jgi:hypothetical protein
VTPGQIGSNPRVVKEADTLHAAGYQVRVVATRSLPHVDKRDESLMSRIAWDLERVDFSSQARWRLSRLRQLSARAAHRATNLPALANWAFRPQSLTLSNAACARPADLYIAHYPAALGPAAMAARRHGARLAYDAEDYHLGDWPEAPRFDAERRLVREVERQGLAQCAYVTAASPGIADAYVSAYAVDRPCVLLNVFSKSAAPGRPTARGDAMDAPTVYWFSQTVGPDRGLECAVRAIGKANARPHLFLRGTVAPGFEQDLRRLAEDVGAAGRVHVLPPAAPDDMETLAAAYDLGLSCETLVTASRRLCLTNKLFTFLLAGVPPLMSSTPAQRQFAEEAGLSDLLYPVDDDGGLAEVLDRIFTDPGRLAALRTKVWTLGQAQYNWDQEQVKLLALVSRTLGDAVGIPSPRRIGPQTVVAGHSARLRSEAS